MIESKEEDKGVSKEEEKQELTVFQTFQVWTANIFKGAFALSWLLIALELFTGDHLTSDAGIVGTVIGLVMAAVMSLLWISIGKVFCGKQWDA